MEYNNDEHVKDPMLFDVNSLRIDLCVLVLNISIAIYRNVDHYEKFDGHENGSIKKLLLGIVKEFLSKYNWSIALKSTKMNVVLLE